MHSEKSNFKPMLWNCKKHGCFNENARLDFSVFYNSLPGSNSFSDVDAITEYCGNGLLIEWKSSLSPLPKGQEIMFKRLTKGKVLTVLWVVGDHKMNVSHTTIIFDGKFHETPAESLDDLNHIIKRWVSWSSENVRFGGHQ